MKIILLTLLLLLPIVGYSQKPYWKENKPKKVVVLHGDGRTDDTEALNAWGRGERVMYRGRVLGNVLQNGRFVITWKVRFNRPNSVVRYNVFVRRYRGFDSLEIIDHTYRVQYYRNTLVDEAPQLPRRFSPVRIPISIS